MDGGLVAGLQRFRWRRRGAWMWPAFIALTVLDAVIGNALPPAGDGWDPIGAGLFGAFLNLAAIVVLSVPLRFVLRRRRPDLPKVVAGDYAGTGMMVSLTVLLLVLGLAHHARLRSDRRTMDDAITRAQAYIGDHAPARFRRNVQYVSTYMIQDGSIYRICVPSYDGPEDYCVVVQEKLPFAQSVAPAGSESNAEFSLGVN
jgi:hypothetical protein